MGIKDIDRTGDSMWDSQFVGEAILDEEFNPSSQESQLFLMQLCANLKEPNDFIVDDTVNCWLDDFEQYIIDQGK